jgi:hypothetical protein
VARLTVREILGVGLFPRRLGHGLAGRLVRAAARADHDLGVLLDPIADKLLVCSAFIAWRTTGTRKPGWSSSSWAASWP